MAASGTPSARSIANVSAGAAASWAGARDPHTTKSAISPCIRPTVVSHGSKVATAGWRSKTCSGSRLTGRSAGANTLGNESQRYVSAFSSANGTHAGAGVRHRDAKPGMVLEQTLEQRGDEEQRGILAAHDRLTHRMAEPQWRGDALDEAPGRRSLGVGEAEVGMDARREVGGLEVTPEPVEPLVEEERTPRVVVGHDERTAALRRPPSALLE